MTIELKKKFKCEVIIEELDKLIEDAVNLFDDYSRCAVSGSNVQKLERFETILLEHLEEKTNFTSTFDSIKSSYGEIPHTMIWGLFCEIGKRQLTPNFDSFLKVLEDKLKFLRAKPINKYTYYVPTRIEFRLNDNELKMFKRRLKKALGVSIKNIPKKIKREIKSNNFKSFLANRKVILELNEKSRDFIYPIDVIDRKISALVGIITFSENLNRSPTKWMSSPVKDMSISTSSLENYSIIVENSDKIIRPSVRSWVMVDTEIGNEVSLIHKNISQIHNNYRGNYKTAIIVLDFLSKKKNKKLKELCENSLKLYFEAAIEKQLEISFLKFWIITERILKQSGKRDDESLVSIIEKTMVDTHLRKMVRVLYKKRNNMVHEFKIDSISQQDRNLSKIIAEQTILLLIDPPTKIANLQEFKILIDNIFSSKSELDSKRKIIDKIIKKK